MNHNTQRELEAAQEATIRLQGHLKNLNRVLLSKKLRKQINSTKKKLLKLKEAIQEELLEGL